jgi:hypothetical protein
VPVSPRRRVFSIAKYVIFPFGRKNRRFGHRPATAPTGGLKDFASSRYFSPERVAQFLEQIALKQDDAYSLKYNQNGTLEMNEEAGM